MNYFLVADRVLRSLSKAFGVPTPKLTMVAPDKRLSGAYYEGEVFLGLDTLKNIHLTVQVARHEFGHYLEDIHNLQDRHTHAKVRRFEKNILALGILPKSQTRLGVEENRTKKARVKQSKRVT